MDVISEEPVIPDWVVNPMTGGLGRGKSGHGDAHRAGARCHRRWSHGTLRVAGNPRN